MFWPHLCRHGVTEKFLACGPPPLEALLLPTYGPVGPGERWKRALQATHVESLPSPVMGLTLQGAGTGFPAEPLGF